MVENPMIFVSPVTDPWWNLAAEQHFLIKEPLQEPLLMLWQSVPSVIIGRYQNPWIECDIGALERENVLLARRPSGGGAVYHDLGNLNYCVISPRASYRKDYTLSFILSVLSTSGIAAHASGKSDMTADGRKFSGNAFRYTASRVLHHGTLLVSADLDQLRRCLTPDRVMESMKGVRSRASTVVNLAELAPDISCKKLSDDLSLAFPRWFGGSAEVHPLTPEHIDVQDQQNELEGWAWIFGKTPEFTRSFRLSRSSDLCEAAVTVSKGIISSVACEDAARCRSISEELVGRRYDEQTMEMYFTGL